MAAVTRTWTGTVSSSWSEPNNWSPAGVPTSADSLVFPLGTASVNNDLPAGTSFGPITFNGYTTLNGNPMTLTDTFSITATYPVTCNADLKIGTSLKLGGSTGNTGMGVYNGSVDVNGQTLTTETSAVLFKTLNGSGTVIAGALNPTYAVMAIAGDGNFNGTLTGSGTFQIEASIPNANVVHNDVQWPAVTGTGTVGNVEASSVSPGNPTDFYSTDNAHSVGTLTTKSLHIGGQSPAAYFDLKPSGASDSVSVNGTVTLDSPVLNVSLPAGVPATGQQFVIISNDGTDAVTGTFSGLPEGAVFNLSGVNFSISYHGGDGNDVVLTVVAVQKTWTGAASSLWSNPANWNPAAIPTSGEPLLFPSNATMTNDLPAGTSFGVMTFKGVTTLSGNPMTLTDTVNISAAYGLTCNADLKIGASLKLGGTVSNTAGVFYNGAIDVNGQTLWIETGYTAVKTLNGTGTVILDGQYRTLVISGDGNFTGTIAGTGMFEVDGSVPNANLLHNDLQWPTLAGGGTLGNVEASQVWPGKQNEVGPIDSHAFGTLTTKSLHIGGQTPGADFDLNPNGTSDSIRVNGTVTLDSPSLSVAMPAGGVPLLGQRYRIIDNDGDEPVAGTFAGLPEGAAVQVSGYTFRITYRGGDGNDVELIVAAQPNVVASQDIASSVTGERVTLSAAVSSPQGQPAGTITFTDNGNPLGVSALVNGSASLNAQLFAIGNHAIAAVYSGGGSFVGASSSPLTHAVTRGETSTAFASAPVAVYGRTQIRTMTSPKAPAAGTVTGSATLSEGGQILTSTTVSGGAVAFDAPMLKPGTHTLAAAYSGSQSFVDSVSDSFQVVVDPAAVQLAVSADGSVLTISLLAVDAVPEIPTGTVTITENGNQLTQQPITGSTNVTLTLAPGHHALHVSDSGDALFEGGSKGLDVDVEGAMPTRHRGVRH